MKSPIFTTLALPFLVALICCRPEESLHDNGSEELVSMSDVTYCARAGIDKCRGADQIVNHANSLASRSYYFQEDPCGTDGQRDAFRHIYSMVWISAIYGTAFAQDLSQHKDPDPANEKNPQVKCQRQMDRINNTYGIRMSRKILSDCQVSLSSKPVFADYRRYQDVTVPKRQERTLYPDRYTDCVGGEVADYINKSSGSTSQGPVVIDRDPSNATKCWLVPASQRVAARGRTQCDY